MATDSPIEVASGHAAVPAAAAQCADCGAPISGKYCAACGQETLIETPTVRHFLHEFADQYVALEGKLGRTLRVLITKPGQLTLDYVEGRRQRYVRPLKLYLTISVLFFGLLGVLPDSLNPISRPAGDSIEAPAKVDQDDKDDKDDKDGDEAKDSGSDPANLPAGVAAAKPKADAGENPKAEKKPEPGSFEAKIETKAEAFSKLSREDQNKLLRQKLADDAPYAMFFLLPYFALLLKWFYRKNRQRYGVHLLFSLHVHSFIFILLAFGFLPLPKIFRDGLQLMSAIYVFLALRRVYGGTVLRTLWRMLWLFFLYVIALSASAVSGILTAMFGASWV